MISMVNKVHGIFVMPMCPIMYENISLSRIRESHGLD